MNKDIHNFFLNKLNNDVFNVIKEYLTIDDKISIQLFSKIKLHDLDLYNNSKSIRVWSYNVFNTEVKIYIRNTNKMLMFTHTHYS